MLLILLAAVLNSISLIYISVMPAIAAIALILYLQLRQGYKMQEFYSGALFGGVSSLILNYWMISVVSSYAKGSLLLGLVCYFASAIVLAAFFGAQFYVAKLLKYREEKRFTLFINAIIYAAVWVSFELVRAKLFSAMPWLSYSLGITEGRSLYLIQLAVYGGVAALSFILVIAAYFSAFAFAKAQWKVLSVPLCLFAFQFITGYYLYNSTISETADRSNSFSAALVMPGLSPDKVWNDQTANQLVSELFALNSRAASSKPSLIVWTETVVPWTYAPDDDFVKELSGETNRSKSYSLLGINSIVNASESTLSNSVYFLNPAGKEKGRYDKQDLLSLVEKPLLTPDGSLILPFLSSYDLKMRAGTGMAPINTPWGKAGIMLCNESTNASLVADLADQGADFLVNIANNNWFADCFITTQHFYNCRLRAVENRKDLIINNNMGVCGLVRASGEIAVQGDGKESQVLTVEVHPNSLRAHEQFYLIYSMAAILLFAIFHAFSFTNKHKTR